MNQNSICACNFRKKKTIHRTTTTDDKKLQSTLKRIGVNAIPAIEEVNIFLEDSVIHFQNPKGKSSHCLGQLRLIYGDHTVHLTNARLQIVNKNSSFLDFWSMSS